MLGADVLSGLIVALMAAAVIASYAFAWYSWRRASHPISDSFALLMFADGSWALFALLGHISPTDQIALLWRAPLTGAAVFATVFWFMFVTRYTADREWIPGVTERVFAALAGLYVLLYSWNPGGLAHPAQGVAEYGILRIPYEEFGPIMLGYTLVTYTVLFLTFGLLGRFVLRSRNLYRKQAAVIFGVTFLVLISTVVFVTGLSPHPRLDLTPMLFVVQAVGVGIALYRYDFLDVEPMAAHTLLDELDDPVFVVKTDGQLVDWNEAADEYVPAEGGRPTIHDLQRLALADIFTKSDGGTAVQTVEPRRLTVEDGSRRTFDVRTTAIEDRYGVPRGHAVVLRDITAQEERKRALETQNERLEEFAGIVSHDLRTPLQLIDGRIELAEQTGDLSHLAAATDAIDRMERMLDDLLRLAREGQTIDDPEPVAIGDAARTAWAGIDAPEASLSVETDQVAKADPARLQRVFENLFRNAVEHSDGPVSVTVGPLADGDGLYVADDGPGIPPAERDSVFEFGVTHSDGGTGFGLAIVQRIVEAHGWGVRATESDSGGARFEIAFHGRGVPPIDP